VVEKCLPVPTGGYAIHVQGLTELVEHHKAIFLTELDRVEALRPQDTRLVADPSTEYRQTRLFLETLLRPGDHLGRHAQEQRPLPGVARADPLGRGRGGRVSQTWPTAAASGRAWRGCSRRPASR
jgi:hypothetical protein